MNDIIQSIILSTVIVGIIATVMIGGINILLLIIRKIMERGNKK